MDETLRDDKGAMRVDASTRFGMLSGYYFADNYTQVIRIQRCRAAPMFQASAR